MKEQLLAIVGPAPNKLNILREYLQSYILFSLQKQKFFQYCVSDSIACWRKLPGKDTPTRPSHPYATTHRAGEDVLAYFCRYHGFAGVALRLSNAFGAPMDLGVDRWTLLVNDLCRQAVEHLITYRQLWTEGQYKVINVGSGKSRTVFEMADSVAKVYKKVSGNQSAATITPTETRFAQNNRSHPFQYAIDEIKMSGFKPKDGRVFTHEDRNPPLCAAKK